MGYRGIASVEPLKEAMRWANLSGEERLKELKDRQKEIEEKYRLQREEREALAYTIVKKNYQELIK